MIRMSVHGMEQLQRRLKALGPRGARALHTGLVEYVGTVMNEAQTRVPVVTGQLRSSAYVRERARNQYRKDLDFGYEAPYAVYVHEIPYEGRTTRGLPGAERNGQGYQWFRNAFNAVTRRATERLLQRLRAAVRQR